MIFRKSVISIFFTVPLIFIITVLVACAPVEYEVTADVHPAGAGDITGSGTYQKGEEVTLTAEPEKGYLFDYWAVDDEEVSTEGSYKLTVESDIMLTAHFYEDELHNLMTKAEAALNEKNWEEAGSYLDEARDLPGAEDEPILKGADAKNASGEEVLNLLKQGKVVTRDRVLADLENLEDKNGDIIYEFPPYKSLEELRPAEPDVELLEQEPEELLNWFKDLSGWRAKLQNFPSIYREKLVLEEGLDVIHARSKQYLEKPVFLFLVGKWEAGDFIFYYVVPTSPGPLLSDSLFWAPDIKPVDASAEEDKVFISLELKEAFSFAGYDFEPGEQYQLVYDIYRKEDGTFRVGDYTIKDLKTGEVLEEVSISIF